MWHPVPVTTLVAPGSIPHPPSPHRPPGFSSILGHSKPPYLLTLPHSAWETRCVCGIRPRRNACLPLWAGMASWVSLVTTIVEPPHAGAPGSNTGRDLWCTRSVQVVLARHTGLYVLLYTRDMHARVDPLQFDGGEYPGTRESIVCQLLPLVPRSADFSLDPGWGGGRGEGSYGYASRIPRCFSKIELSSSPKTHSRVPARGTPGSGGSWFFRTRVVQGSTDGRPTGKCIGICFVFFSFFHFQAP